MFHKVYIVINPASGKSQPILNTFYEVFREKDIKWDVGVLQKDNIHELIERAQQFQADVIGVYGGDGTVSAVARHIYSKKIPMAILPGGTANVMSRELNIPADLNDACQMLLHPNPNLLTIDIGRVNECFFLSQVGIGFVSKAIDQTTQESKSRFGTAAYIAKGLKNFFSNNDINLKITIDGHEIETKAFSCIVSNSGNLGIGNLRLSPVDISDGLLDVFLIRELNLKSLNAVVLDLMENNQKEPLMHWRGRKICLKTDANEPIQYDGEILKADLYEIEIVKHALCILIPEQGNRKQDLIL